MKSQSEEYKSKLKQLGEMEEALKLKQGLPHLFGYPWYLWSRRIFESKNREIFLTSANQVGKSSCAIRKNINLATNPKLWKEFWPGLMPGQIPGLFWYMYPAHSVATTEVENKWIKEFLPRGEYRDHPQFGWKLEYAKNEVHALHFNTGVTIQFKSYNQKARDLQTSSVYHLTCDEELPVELLPELSARLNATNGYFLSVFTATLGQMHWKQTMEPATAEEEKHKDALKIQVSLYDSMFYEDGAPSPWTKEKIARAISNCPSEMEIQRRIMGRFVKSEGLAFEGFSLEKNMINAKEISKDWQTFSGIDPGTGGKSGHPAAMVFVKVNPNYREGIVYKGWRGDGIPTTSQDILDKYRDLKGSEQCVGQVYDYAAKDFFLIASRSGEAFSPADKGRDRGFALLNTLFKSGMLKIPRGDQELEKLVNELCSLSVTVKKTVAVDDLCFSGETKVFTSRGDIPISQVKVGDFALTRQGFKRVLAKTEALSYVITVSHEGEETWVTANHNYILKSGELKPAKDLCPQDVCLALSKEEKQKFTSLMGLGLEGIPSKKVEALGSIITHPANTLKVALAPYTKSFIGFLLAPFRRVTAFIILTAIRSTIISKTLNWLIQEGTCQTTCLSQSGSSNRKKQLLKRKLRQLLGIRAPKPSRFISGLGGTHGPIENMLKRFVRLAASPIRLWLKSLIAQDFAPIIVNQRLAAPQVRIISKKIVWSVAGYLPTTNMAGPKPALKNAAISSGSKQKISRVFNITVQGAHEYFANGVLVANCDALRYCVSAIPWDFSAVEMGESEKKRLGIQVEEPRLLSDRELRRDWHLNKTSQVEASIESELDYWDELFGASE